MSSNASRIIPLALAFSWLVALPSLAQPAPTGACCLFDQTCIETTENDCFQQGGTYRGDDTDCDSSDCTLYCTYRLYCIYGDCTNCPYSVGQVFVGRPCTQGCPSPIGLQCDGCCLQFISNGCRLRIAGDVLMPIAPACPIPVGACCFESGFCTPLPRCSCENSGGFYAGDGTGCASVACPTTGACCLLDGSCTDLTRQDCEQLRGIYRGLGTSCAGGDCPLEACCMRDGTCLDLQADVCTTNYAGTPQGPGSTCAQTNCPQPRCIYRVTCIEGDCTNCGLAVGQVVFGPLCPPGVNCDYEVRQTCGSSGCCVRYLQMDCRPPVAGELPMPPGTPCVRLPTGACCMYAPGGCQDLTRCQCEAQGGTYLGDGTTCASDGCPRACCFTDGPCQQLSPAQCFALGGEPQRLGSQCDFAMEFCPREACCMPDDTCVFISYSDCLQQGGVPQGPFTFCPMFGPCPRGPCCFPDGTCADQMTRADCASAGGTYSGDGLTCDQIFCPQPVCIYELVCVEGDDCGNCPVTIGQRVYGDPCPGGAACGQLVIQIRCGDVAAGCCLTFLHVDCRMPLPGEFQIPTVGFECQAPPPTGACCRPQDGFCFESTRCDCEVNGFIYQGDGTNCETVQCQIAPRGCCLQDGGCVEVTPAECLQRCGRLQGYLTTCASTTCGGCQADFNQDGVVDLADLTLILSLFGTCRPPPPYLQFVDLNCDGCIALADLTSFLSLFGLPCP